MVAEKDRNREGQAQQNKPEDRRDPRGSQNDKPKPAPKDAPEQVPGKEYPL